MAGLLRGVARTAVIAGTATAVSNGVSRRQQGRWAQQEQQQYAAQQAAQPQQQYPPQQVYAAPVQAAPVYAPPPPPAPPAPPAPSADPTISRIKELAGLRDAGVLTEEEFSAAKARLLGM